MNHGHMDAYAVAALGDGCARGELGTHAANVDDRGVESLKIVELV